MRSLPCGHREKKEKFLDISLNVAVNLNLL
jgi:hypothetical protein